MSSATSTISPVDSVVWAGLTGTLVFFMQVGFYCLETAFVPELYTRSIIVKNLEDTIVCSMIFVVFGYSIGFDASVGNAGIIGGFGQTLLINTDHAQLGNVFFQAAFAVAACTIISGAVLERMKNGVYVCWVSFVAAIQYPILLHWVWGQGWLYRLKFTDFAGCAAIHMTGAISSGVAIALLGPRSNQVDPITHKLKPKTGPRSLSMLGMGVLFLWFGWFGFNAGSAPVDSPNAAARIGAAAINTLLAPAVSASGGLIYLAYKNAENIDAGEILNCVLAGLVSVTASAGNIRPWAAICIGILTPPVYFISSHQVRDNSILPLDDPLDVVTVHGVCGALGLIFAGIFQAEDKANGLLPGLVYGGFQFFGIQLLGVCSVLIYNLVMSYLCYRLISSTVFRGRSLKVTLFDVYLGTKMYVVDPSGALVNLLTEDQATAYDILNRFHGYTIERGCETELNFLLSILHLKGRIHRLIEVDHCRNDEPVSERIQYGISAMRGRYLGDGAPEQVNVSVALIRTLNKAENQRAMLSRSMNLQEASTCFDIIYDDVLRTMLQPFREFMQKLDSEYAEMSLKQSVGVGVPFAVQEDFSIEWK